MGTASEQSQKPEDWLDKEVQDFLQTLHQVHSLTMGNQQALTEMKQQQELMMQQISATAKDAFPESFNIISVHVIHFGAKSGYRFKVITKGAIKVFQDKCLLYLIILERIFAVTK